MKSVLLRERVTFIILLCAIVFMGYAVERSSFFEVLLGYAVGFAAFFDLVERKERLSVRSLWIYALILRVVLLFSIPKLSDDFFRFIWDGLVQLEGMSPFSHLPSDIQQEAWKDIYEGMNSKDYYSVYPPVMQVIFSISAALAGTHILGNIILMRMAIILADMLLMTLGIRLLRRLGRPSTEMVFFALNPLIIIECTGNLHFESMMMAFGVLGIYLMVRQGELKSFRLPFAAGLALSMGILTKLTSALIVPSLYRRAGFMRTFRITLFCSFIAALAFWPMLDLETMRNMSSSLDLYFRNFQFNSSLYNVIDSIAAKEIPHFRAERIGPVLAIIGAICMVIVMLFRSAKNWTAYMETLLFVFSIHLLFASTVHPWYIVNLLVIALFTRYRYPMLWSMTAVLSYHFYGLSEDSPLILLLEYLPVIGYAIWEMRSSSSTDKGVTLA